MSVGIVFKTFVERSLERIPVLEVTHEEHHQGRDFIITQTIQRNVLTEFDRKLSRHLAATRGAGFPAFTVTVDVAERGGMASPHPLARAHYASAPHALKGIAERALGEADRAELTLHHNDPGAGERDGGARRVVTVDDVEALDAGLGICRYLGEAEFLDISGDFDIVMVAPPGGQRPVVMHLKNGSITMPCGSGGSVTPFESPLHGFAGHVAESMLAQGYMAEARHALVAAKEAAVAEFREAAERHILNFDRALAGRALDGHRFDSAMALVERLKAGLGPGLEGLSEDARITALEWSITIEAGGGGPGSVSRRVSLAHFAGK